MAAEKKIRKKIFNNFNPQKLEGLSERQKRIATSEIRKVTNEITGDGLRRFTNLNNRQFPCQMIKGQFAVISSDAKPEFRDDGKWYLDNELIVSEKYKANLRIKELEESIKKEKEKEKDIANLKPQILGEE
jgi:hypothetical protein